MHVLQGRTFTEYCSDSLNRHSTSRQQANLDDDAHLIQRADILACEPHAISLTPRVYLLILQQLHLYHELVWQMPVVRLHDV